MIDQKRNTFKHFGEPVGPVGGKGYHETRGGPTATCRVLCG